MNKIDLKELAQIISAKASKSENPFILAIDGRSGCGKSTLSVQLSKYLDAAVVSGDDFYAGGVDLRDDTPETLAADCIDWQKIRSILIEFRQKNDVEFYPFDWNAFDGALSKNVISIASSNIVILEGVYSNRSELRDLIDFSILIQIDDEVRLQRLRLREGHISKWERQWHRGEEWYFTHDALADKFDVLI